MAGGRGELLEELEGGDGGGHGLAATYTVFTASLPATREDVRMDDAAAIADFWDARAREDPLRFADEGARDEADFWARGERALDQLLGRLDVALDGAAEVLDLGCGPGRIARALAARVRRVVALDVSAEMLAQARVRNPRLANVEWLLGDGETLEPIPTASLDAAIAVRVLTHLPDPHLTLGYVAELARVLRPGGWAGFQVSTEPDAHHAPRRAPAPLRDPRWLGSALPLDAIHAVALEHGMDIVRIDGTRSPRSLILGVRQAG